MVDPEDLDDLCYITETVEKLSNGAFILDTETTNHLWQRFSIERYRAGFLIPDKARIGEFVKFLQNSQ